MRKRKISRHTALETLNRTVAKAAEFFCSADEKIADGYQTAREVISHLVFWHREYVVICQALADGRRPKLRTGVFREFNAMATLEFKNESLPVLARRFCQLQNKLDRTLQCLPDWEMNFPIKEGGHWWSVQERIPTIESHIRNHVARLRRAAKRMR